MVGMPARRYDIDWLRLMAVFLLLFFHAACVFHPWSDFYIKNDQLSPVIAYVFVWTVGHWHMSLFSFWQAPLPIMRYSNGALSNTSKSVYSDFSSR